jgi:hypothetical protein
MEKIEQLAHASVARGCGFAMLAIATTMIGLSSQFDIALRAGGLGCLLMCFVLIGLSWRAPATPYKQTELWLMLEPAERPQPTVAQDIISAARQEALLEFALRSAWLALALLSMALLWGLFPSKAAM